MSETTPKIAVYWDFENLHASIYEQETGDEYKSYQIQREKLLNVPALMDYIYSLGDVVINRAYNDWQFYRVYKNELLFHSIDLIQLYPKGKFAKNGADIRLAMDALEDAYQNAHMTHAVIIGGDSDYIAVAQKLKKLGRFVIGIGVQATTNPFWTRSCNEFKYYETLARKAQQAQIEVADDHVLAPQSSSHTFAAARELLIKAVQRLMAEDDVDAVLKAKVRPMMTRLDPGFDPANYNFQTFNAFITACNDVIRSFKGEYDMMIALRQSPASAALAAPAPDSTSVASQPLPPQQTAALHLSNPAIDYFLWAMQLNYINDTVKITLSDIGVTFKLLAPDFSIQSYGYPKNNGLKVLAEDVSARGYITIEYDQAINVHYVFATSALPERIRVLPTLENQQTVRCLRVMNKLHLFLRPDDILMVFNATVRIFEAYQARAGILTVAALFIEVVDTCGGPGQHPKKLHQILTYLVTLGMYATDTDEPVTIGDQRAITQIRCRDEADIITRYLEFVTRQVYDTVGEVYSLAYLRSLFVGGPATESAVGE